MQVQELGLLKLRDALDQTVPAQSRTPRRMQAQLASDSPLRRSGRTREVQNYNEGILAGGKRASAPRRPVQASTSDVDISVLDSVPVRVVRVQVRLHSLRCTLQGRHSKTVPVPRRRSAYERTNDRVAGCMTANLASLATGKPSGLALSPACSFS